MNCIELKLTRLTRTDHARCCGTRAPRLTSAVAVAQVGEPPQVAHADGEAEGRHDEVQFASPRPSALCPVVPLSLLSLPVTGRRRGELILVLKHTTSTR